MRLSPLPRPPVGELGLLALSLSLLPEIRATTFTSAPPANLDLSQLGRVALAGNFDSISLYNYIGQDEDGLHTNGSQSLLGRYPNGDFAPLAEADAAIQAMCSFVSSDGTFNGVLVAGNFTSLGGQEAQAVAFFDPDTRQITPLPGLTGQVSAVYCDQEQSSVYFGGSFSGGQSTNAIAWTTTWMNTPFAGFNGPVAAITKLPNGNVVFGGSFTGIGNNDLQPRQPDAQVVNIPSANITSAPNTATQPGYSDGRNIICKTSDQTGPGNDWLLADGAQGFWQADFGFGFEPTKLRLYQSQVPNYGTKTWRFTAQPINGIMNFTFVGPDGVNSSCTNECPLPDNNSTYQDFHFVNSVGMNSFRIDISDYYGAGAGLGGIELFQDDIYSFAIQSFNEPRCDGVSLTGSQSRTTGDWTVNDNASGMSSSQYLQAYFPDGTGPTTDLSVVFTPDIRQSGNYSVTVYTPGCIGDNSCDNRGIVSITGRMSMNPAPGSQTIDAQLYQTNNYDKYDEVYNGYVDATSDSFAPTITLTPTPNQGGPLLVVAQRVRFELKNSTGGLNGLFEFNPNEATVTTDFSTSIIDKAGTSLDDEASITSLVVPDGQDSIYVGGMFSSGASSNVMAINLNGGNNAPMPSGGLNDAVQSMVADGTTLYLGGNFTNTRNNDVSGLSNVAAFETSNQTWQALGAGVNGMVWNLIPLDVNVAPNQTEQGIAVSGWFDQVLGFGGYPSFAVQSLAIWVPSRNNWLRNLDEGGLALAGRLTAFTDVPNSDPIFAGRVDSQSLDMSGVAELQTSGSPSLTPIGINIHPLQPADPTILRKRDTSELPIEGVVAGLFYTGNDMDMTVIGGHFTATASNGSDIQNLALIDRAHNNQVTGLAGNFSDSEAVLALEYQDSTLFVGGSMTPSLLLWDLAGNRVSPSQPQALVGNNPMVKAISAQPDSSFVYVGGSFLAAGSFDCPALCVYDTASQRWQNPFNVIGDSSVINAMTWASSNQLIVAGNMTISGNYTTMASYDAGAKTFKPLVNAGNHNSVPGPITTFTAIDSSYSTFFVSGISDTDGSYFVARFDGQSTWTSLEGLLEGSQVQSLQTLMLTQDHASSDLLPSDSSLLLAGKLVLPNFGNVSAAVFDGNVWTPFALSTLTDGTPGSIFKAFVQNPQNLLHSSEGHHLALGIIVVIGLALALALVMLIVGTGILAERYRRKREGYVKAPTTPSQAPAYEKQAKGNVGDIPAEQLFSGIGGNGNNGSRL